MIFLRKKPKNSIYNLIPYENGCIRFCRLAAIFPQKWLYPTKNNFSQLFRKILLF